MALPTTQQILSGYTPEDEKKKKLPTTAEIMAERSSITPELKEEPKEGGIVSGVKKFAKGIAKFGVGIAVEGSNLINTTVDFLGDVTARQVEKSIRGNEFARQPGDFRTRQADRWRNFYDRTGGKITEEAKRGSELMREIEFIQPSDEWKTASTKEKLTTRLPETIATIGPGVVASLGAFAINPILGFTLAAGSVADEIDELAQESGLDEDKAQALGLGTGLLIGWVDKIVPDEVFSPQQRKQFMSGIAKRIVKTGIKEAGTEVAQEDIQIAVELTLREDLGVDEIVERNLMSGLGGLLGGSSVQTITSFTNNIRSGDIGGLEEEDYGKLEPTQEDEVIEESFEPEVITVETKPYKGVKKAVATVKDDVGLISVDGSPTSQRTQAVRDIEAQLIERGITTAKIKADDDTVGIYAQLGYKAMGKTTNGIIPMVKTLEAVSPTIETEKPPVTTTEDVSSLLTEAGKYQSVEDFSDAVLSASPDQQIGFVDPKTVTSRDTVGRGEPEYEALKADIKKNGIKEPVRVQVLEDGRVETIDGSQRTAIAEELGIQLPIIVTQGNIDGLQTIREVYETTSKSQPVESKVSTPDALIEEARTFDNAVDFRNRTKQRDAFTERGIRSQEQYDRFFEEANKGVEKKNIIDSVNPTGGVLVDYNPQERVEAELADNITTLDKTAGKSPDTVVTIYRGAPANQNEIVPGDFITTSRELAESYTGEGNVLSKRVPMKDILDDSTEPLGEEYIYRPQDQSPTAKKTNRGEAKKTVAKPKTKIDEKTQEIVSAFEEKTGRPLEKATVKQIRGSVMKDGIMKAGDILPLNSKSEVILNKLVSAAKGQQLSFSPGSDARNEVFFYGGLANETFTDGFVAITDKKAAKKVQDKLLSRIEKKRTAELKKASKNITDKQAKNLVKQERQSKIEDSKEKFPPVDKVIPDTYSKKNVDILGFNGAGHVYLSNGDEKAVVDGNKLAFIQKSLPGAKMRLARPGQPVVFEKGGRVQGLLMPLHKDTDFPFDIKKGQPKKNTKTYASYDDFADLPNITQQSTFKSVPFPEMVQFAKDLMGSYPTIKSPRKRKGGRPNGFFVPKQDGSIVLNPDIFSDPEQAAKTLAHEIGHLIDYMPDLNIKRGNLLGRIATMRKFMRHSFTTPKTESQIDKLIEQKKPLQEQRRELRDENGNVSDKKKDKQLRSKIMKINRELKKLQDNAFKLAPIKDELRNLSYLWRPLQIQELAIDASTGKVEMITTEITEDEASEDYLAYRNSPEELYADALSVLINDPARLRKEAPVFYEKFFEFLDRKPQVKKEYFALMDHLNSPDEVIQERRLNKLYEGFAEAREKRKDIEQKEKPKKPILEKLMQQHVTRFDPIYRKLKKTSKGFGMELSPQTEVRMQLEEMQMRQNEAFLFLNETNRDILEPLQKVGLTEDDLGVLLVLERNLGERSDIANPYGLQGKYAQESLDYFKESLRKRGIDEDQFNILQQVARKFRSNQFKIVEEATKVGIYSKEFFEETAKPNQNSYVTYQVIDYIHDNYVSAGVKKATGTLKQVENPFVSSMMKTLAVLNQIEIQKGKVGIVKQLEQNFPGDITPSTPQKVKSVRVGWKSVENKEALELYEDGKLIAYDVDPYIKEMFDMYSPTELHSLVEVSGKFNRIFKPLVTTWNVSWGFYSNISRDTRRTYKNLASIMPTLKESKGVSVLEFVSTWLRAIPRSKNFQKGEVDSLLEEMIKNKAYTTAFAAFDPQANQEESMQLLMRKYRFLGSDVKQTGLKKKILSPLRKLLDGIEFAASTLETTTKVAGYQIAKKRTNDPRMAAHITRNYVGTPNFIDGGTQKHVDNNVFVFSNVMIQGVRTDLEIATNPKTRSGYFYRTFMIDIMPKLMMAGAAAGLFGEALKDIMDKATEYDKSNYIVVPIGVRANGKAVYMRIPQDETGRLFGALTWKLASAINGDLKKPEQIFSLGAGYIPSVTPMWEVGGAWIQYAQGRNPYDSFRGRQVVDDLTWQAGGLPVFEKMVQYTTNQLGFSQFSTYSDESDTTFDTIIKTTPVINRAFRSTDYGLTEKDRALEDSINKENAKRLLKERELLDEAVEEGKKSPGDAKDIGRQLILDAYGEGPYDKRSKTRIRNLQKKYRIGLVKGSVSRELDNLISANTNEYKVQLLSAYKESMTRDEFRNLIKTGIEYKVISRDLIKELKHEGIL